MTPQTDTVNSEIAARPATMRKKATYALGGCLSLVFIYWLASIEDEKPVTDRTVVAQNGAIGSDFVPVPAAPAPTPVAMKPPAVPAPQARPTGMNMPNLPMNFRPPAPPTPISAFQASINVKQETPAAADTPASRGASSRSSVEQVSTSGGGTDRLDDGLGAGRDGGTVSATMLPDRNLFMTMGTPIPCTLEQPINTQVPGPFRCKVRGQVYSTSGAVPLLDDGTWAFGRVTKSLDRGMDRAFAIITRLETPQGCLVKLRSSLGDQLGTPGIEGEVDTHFFERFQGVAMIALLDAAGQAAALAASNAIGSESGITFNQFESGSNRLAQGSYGDDISIPPTLRAAPARQVLIMAMDDIDMRPCFSLRTAR